MRYSQHHLLSSRGSDRATAYEMSNKALTLNGRTHVVWTDAVALTRGRTFDHATGQWGEVNAIGEGCDNHNTPCLTADREGRLHIAYGPHGPWDHVHRICLWPTGQFHYAVAAEPNSLAGLETNQKPFGYAATYASLVHTAWGRDALVCRGGEQPYALMFQVQLERGGWSPARALMREDLEPQYVQHHARLTCAPDGTLYVVGHFYAVQRGHSLGLAALKSVDRGATWTDLAGAPADLPITYGPRFAVPHPAAEDDPRLGGSALDADGGFWVFAYTAQAGGFEAILSRWDGRAWAARDVGPWLPAGLGCIGGSLCIDTRGRLHLAVAAVNRTECPRKQILFGYPSAEVFHLCSADGGHTFECHQVSETDPQTANWLPIISQAGVFHAVEQPVILYTHGNPQGNAPELGCRHNVETDVYCVFVED